MVPIAIVGELQYNLDKVFECFAKMDKNKSHSVDAAELALALDESPQLKERLCAAAELDASASVAVLAVAIIAAADVNKDGIMQMNEFEALLRGWSSVDWTPVDKLTEAERDRQHRLAGAAVRAEQNRIENGGFAGLTNADEALKIGQEVNRLRLAQQTESDPTVFGGGSVYVTDERAKAERTERESEIREQEAKELNLKTFDGLGVEEALRVGLEVKLGGEVVGMDAKKPKKAVPKAL
ncbi:hypothetical protein B484DRAFT_404624 [Ochromonadaceae sp. CCMP2298]|nr:hypothetical protein B484DRAFT_404624 [Ochromonadaceae sp. CCMP2298]